MVAVLGSARSHERQICSSLEQAWDSQASIRLRKAFSPQTKATKRVMRAITQGKSIQDLRNRGLIIEAIRKGPALMYRCRIACKSPVLKTTRKPISSRILISLISPPANLGTPLGIYPRKCRRLRSKSTISAKILNFKTNQRCLKAKTILSAQILRWTTPLTLVRLATLSEVASTVSILTGEATCNAQLWILILCLISQ